MPGELIYACNGHANGRVAEDKERINASKINPSVVHLMSLILMNDRYQQILLRQQGIAGIINRIVIVSRGEARSHSDGAFLYLWGIRPLLQFISTFKQI